MFMNNKQSRNSWSVETHSTSAAVGGQFDSDDLESCAWSEDQDDSLPSCNWSSKESTPFGSPKIHQADPTDSRDSSSFYCSTPVKRITALRSQYAAEETNGVRRSPKLQGKVKLGMISDKTLEDKTIASWLGDNSLQICKWSSLIR